MILFGKQWFERHQRGLLWLCNAPLVRIWFRWVLCIRRCDLAHGKRIITLAPNHYMVAGRKPGEFQAEFRTHEKYGKRLYFAFMPLWYALHCWDWLIADRVLPDLSFGFDTYGPVYPDAGNGVGTSVDGWCARSTSNAAWSGIIAGAGTNFSATASTNEDILRISSGTTAWNWMQRAIFHFDTSTLDDAATISAAVMSVVGFSKTDPLAITPDINLYASTVTSGNTLAATDYLATGATAFCDTPITYANWNTTPGYNDWSMNATGIAAISKTGITKLALRNANYDVAAQAPAHTASLTTTFIGRYADYTGTASDPKLVITYTVGGGADPAPGLDFAHQPQVQTIMGM